MNGVSLIGRKTVILMGLFGSIAAMDLDTGTDAVGAVRLIDADQTMCDGWFRIRGIVQPPSVESIPNLAPFAGAQKVSVADTKTALRDLRHRKLKACVMIRLPTGDWRTNYLPDDQREAFERGRWLGATYGDLIGSWEIDNEPDLGFVPENAERYVAYLKASYLGLRAGMAEARNNAAEPENVPNPSPQHSQQAPLVLMAPLGLPPGPWLERFVANDGFAYTDGYNYHYYGYAEDFTGVYRQHEAAFRELGAGSFEWGANSSKLIAKSYPIFLTEIGYGMLGKEARNTKDGRLRQWRWFKSVGEQATALRIEAPMAFYLPPYLEYDTSEYGLTVPAVQRTENGGQRVAVGAETFWSGGIQYEPSDFDALRAEPWMKLIGKQIGGNEVTPALAQWLAVRAKGKKQEGRTLDSRHQSSESRSWTVSTPRTSPIVIDFLPGEGLSTIKRYNGHFVTATAPVAVDKDESGKVKSEKPKPPKTPGTKPEAPPIRAEEFIMHVRTANGNLYEVYPARSSGPVWQQFLEEHDNFNLSPYGRAEAPWRFKDNKPVSLMIAFYPKKLPAAYEFRSMRLLKLAALSSQPSASKRYGRGRVVLYNFAEKEISGRLLLPQSLTIESADNVNGTSSVQSEKSVAKNEQALKLQPGERRVVYVSIQVPADGYARHKVEILFVPEQTEDGGLKTEVGGMVVSRLVTEFIPTLEGIKTVANTELLQQVGKGEGLSDNAKFIRDRVRVSEEAPMLLQQGKDTQVFGEVYFAQHGATVAPTADGFTVAITDRPRGKQQRVEVEIPWPDGLEFSAGAFLSVDFRLKPE